MKYITDINRFVFNDIVSKYSTKAEEQRAEMEKKDKEGRQKLMLKRWGRRCFETSNIVGYSVLI